MIGDYLNQTATLKSAGAIAPDGSRTYTDSTIRCRFEPRVRQYTNEKGEIVASQATLFTLDEVGVNDRIDYDGRDWPVIRVLKRWGMDALDHYEVWL